MKHTAETEDSSEENSEEESNSSEEESSLKVRSKRKKGDGRKEEGVTKDPKLDERDSEKPEPVYSRTLRTWQRDLST